VTYENQRNVGKKKEQQAKAGGAFRFVQGRELSVKERERRTSGEKEERTGRKENEMPIPSGAKEYHCAENHRFSKVEVL